MNIKEFEETLGDAEILLDRLRGLYEQWFQGIERLEPTIPKKDMERKIRAMRRAVPRNTALRFRFNRLVQKYTTYMTYWQRVARQIEEGTYRRDVLRARRRRQQMREQWRSEREEDEAPKTYELDIDVDVDLGDIGDIGDIGVADATAAQGDGLFGSDDVMKALDALAPDAPLSDGQRVTAKRSLSPFAITSRRPASPAEGPAETNDDQAAAPKTFTVPKPSPARGGMPARLPLPGGTGTRPKPAPKVAAAFAGSKPASGTREKPPARPAGDDAEIRNVFDRYVEARKRNNERVDNVKYDKVKASIEKMLPKLREKHKGRKIDFEVVLKDGRVGIKPVPK
jgi:hypothetical protein